MAGKSDFELSDCRVEPLRNRLSSRSARVILEPRVMDVLVSLATHHPEVLTRDELIQKQRQPHLIHNAKTNKNKDSHI